MKKVLTRLVAHNLDSDTVVASRVTVATRKVERAIGLLTRRRFDAGEGLLIMPCHGVHTWGMRFAIDIVALDESGTVVDAVPALKPWRIRLPRAGAVNVLELPAGSLSRSNTAVGHRIEFNLAPAWEAR